MHLGKTRNQKKMIMEYVTPSAYDLLLSEEDVKLRYITPAITRVGDGYLAALDAKIDQTLNEI